MAKTDGIGVVQSDTLQEYDAATYGPGGRDLEALDVEIGSPLTSQGALVATAIQYAAAAICAAIWGKKESPAKKPGKATPPPEESE